MSFDHAKELYRRIVTANGISHAPQIVLNPTDEVNASYNGYVVQVNAGMLRFVRNDAQMAFVLGHELGHYVRGHIASTPTNEYEADALGAIYISHLGYSICSGVEVVRRFHSPDSATHPNSESRYHRLCH